MSLRLMQAALISAVAACSAAPSQSQAQANGAGRPFKVSEVASFGSPWAMDFLPGSGVPLTNMALVTERSGKLWLLDVASGAKQEVGGVPASTMTSQGGLADVVAHPGFAGNQRVYISFTEGDAKGLNGGALGYGRLILGQGAPRIEGFKIIWRQAPKVTGGGHYSQRIAFAPDGTIFLSSGERQKMDPAQDPASDLGKVIHMTDEGQRIGGHHYSMGHRNALGLAFAPDGRLWETEMGPQGGDELNLIIQGKNYGWPRVSYGSHYDGRDIPDAHASAGFEEPKLWWNPSISPGGLLIYSGDLFPQWKGDALIAALSGQALIRADIDGDKATKADQWDMGMRIRAVDQGPRGEVYLLVDEDSGGKVLRLEPANAK